MNNDFIKWIVDKAEGFEFDYHAEVDFIKYPNGKSYAIEDLRSDPIIWPLLLVRAIEGINMHDDNITIIQDFEDISVSLRGGELFNDFPINRDPDGDVWRTLYPGIDH